jgi:hypothetical protein
MTTLYDYGNQLSETVEMIQDLLSEGVSTDDERVQELLEKMVSDETDWESKAINVAKFLNQLSLDVVQIESEIERLTKKKKSNESAHKNLHDLLMWQMETFGKTEIKNPLLTIKVKENPPSLIVEREDLVPDKFKAKKEVVTVNKNAIKQALKDGEAIDGVKLINTKKLTIK